MSFIKIQGWIQMNDNKNQYWATLPVDEIGNELKKRVDSYYDYMQSSGHFKKIRKSFRTYYGFSDNGNSSDIMAVGAEGELSSIVVADYRNLIQHVLIMTCAQRPAFDVHATNSDHASQSQAILGKGLLDYYLREKKLERYLRDAVEFSLWSGEGFVEASWNQTSGETYGVNPETGAPVQEGDIEYSVHSPLDVIRDINKDDANFSWVIVRTFENKYDLAAKFPDLADKILSTTSNSKIDSLSLSWKGDETDLIPTYKFYHSRSEACPQGRLVQFVNHDCILIDSPLPYRKLPVFRIAPSNQSGSPFGYTSAFDLLGIADASNTLYSTVITNQSTFGVQSITVPKGSDISIQEVSSGLNLIEYDHKMGEIKPLQLTSTPPEVFKMIEMLDRKAETLSGVNNVARGNPDASLKSGSALALVQSQAINFNSGLQQSYAQLLEDCGLMTLQMLMDFAQVPRVAMIVGKTSKYLMKDFTGKDLQNISRVSCDMGNPLTRTTAGRVELAQNLLQSGLITHADQFLQVINTGSLEPLTEGDQAELMNIRSENEWLSDGKSVQAIITDEHALHINEHKTVLASPEARQNPNLLQVTLDHINQHLNLLRTSDPQLLQMLKQQPLAPQQQAQPQQQGPPPQQAQHAMNNTAQVLNATNPVTQQAGMVRQPRIPVSPIKQ
jgi:hypothetical protein